MRMIIVGAGKTGAFLAENLHKEHHVTLIDQRHNRIEVMRQMLPDVTVIEGDACEPAVLERAGIEGADLVAAVTGDDEDNLVVAMLSKHIYHAAKVYGRVNHPENEWLFDSEWGVDVAVSSPAVLFGLIEKDVGFGDLITLLKLQADNISIDEITLPASAKAVGHKLMEVPLPPNVSVMAILADEGYVQIARGGTVLVAGDQLLLLVEGALDRARVLEAFGIAEDAASDAQNGGTR
ncbi:MAG: TrkA family potassium uptake protein [Actinobacteria bacterium]|nr:MAG: TrkA family potassium uptake protein [Actinomycetota bacterium]